MREFEKANKLMKRIKTGEADWARLFKPLSFFQAYQSYLRFDILTNDGADYEKLHGYFEMRLKWLVKGFELAEEKQQFPAHITMHPWPQALEFEDPKYDKCQTFFVGMSMKKRERAASTEKQEVQLTPLIENFYRSLWEDKLFPYAEFKQLVDIKIEF